MIQDLIIFTNELISPTHEVILLVDANEAFISSECGLTKLTRKTNLTDPIFKNMVTIWNQTLISVEAQEILTPSVPLILKSS